MALTDKRYYVGMRDRTDPTFFVYIKELGDHHLTTTPNKDRAQKFNSRAIGEIVIAVDEKYSAYFENRDLVIVVN